MKFAEVTSRGEEQRDTLTADFGSATFGDLPPLSGRERARDLLDKARELRSALYELENDKDVRELRSKLFPSQIIVCPDLTISKREAAPFSLSTDGPDSILLFQNLALNPGGFVILEAKFGMGSSMLSTDFLGERIIAPESVPLDEEGHVDLSRSIFRRATAFLGITPSAEVLPLNELARLIDAGLTLETVKGFLKESYIPHAKFAN